MSIFTDVRNAVTAKDAAMCCGIRPDRYGKALCPFHNDKNPSLKLDKRYHCFGCQADGDAIDFVSRYYDIAPLEAAKKLADEFRIPYDAGQREIRVTKRDHKKIPEHPKDDVAKAYRTLCGWLHLLTNWQEIYAPDDTDTEWDPRFATALECRTQLEYILDQLFLNPEQKNDTHKFCEENRMVLDAIGRYLEKIREQDCAVKRSRTHSAT